MHLQQTLETLGIASLNIMFMFGSVTGALDNPETQRRYNVMSRICIYFLLYL